MTPGAPKRIAVFGGSFNPPGLHHRAIAERLAADFDEVIVVPCGPRPDKPVTNDVEPVYRAAMTDMTFRGLPGARVELFDLEARTFTRTHELDERFRREGEVWHVVGADLVEKGRDGRSRIHAGWDRGAIIWNECNFAVVKRPGYAMDPADLPPRSRVFEVNQDCSSSEIRTRVYRRQPIVDLVVQPVAEYVERHALYRGGRAPRSTTMRLEDPRPLVVHDERNGEAREIAARFGAPDAADPNVIVVVGGDGTMLRAIRRHWRRRIPFYGVNAGHMGFLLNRADGPLAPGRDLVLQQLSLLWIETENPKGETRTWLAFNDAWVERAQGQTAWIEVRIDGHVRMSPLVADGALVATAAGSTSYARAMGATPLPLNTPALLFVGSNVLKPELLKPAVLPLDTELEMIGLGIEKRPLRGYIDGVHVGEVKSMRARVSNIAAVELAFDPDMDPSEKLARIQFPPPGEE